MIVVVICGVRRVCSVWLKSHVNFMLLGSFVIPPLTGTLIVKGYVCGGSASQGLVVNRLSRDSERAR